MRIEKELDVAIGEGVYRLASDDEYLEHVKGGFEPHMVDLFNTLIQKKDYVLDVGANIGCTSILFGERAHRVFAFEPCPSTFRFLEKNISRSGLKNIELNNLGLGSEPGQSEITYASSNRSGAFVSDKTRASAGHVTETILIKRLDDVVAELNIPRIDFIKIDVEGFEQHVLDGGKKVITAFMPVVVLELNHWCLNALQRICVPDFFDHLRSMFPVLCAVDGASYANLHEENESYAVMYQHIVNFKYANIVAAFNDAQLSRFCSGIPP